METLDTEEIIPKKYRCFEFVLYPDSTSYDCDSVLFALHNFKYWVYILHSAEDDEKKDHYHCLIKLDNATTISSIANRLGIPIYHVQYVKNIRSMCRYFLHADDPNKKQYSIDDCHISKLFIRKFRKNFEDIKTEEEIIEDIYFWIDNCHFDTYHDKLKFLIMYINFNCYDTIYKRYKLEFLDYLKLNI